MTIPERLDRLVHVARLDVLTRYGGPRRRNLRWLPLLVLVALPVNYGVLVAVANGALGSPGRMLFNVIAASLLFFAVFLAAQVVRLLGPKVGWDGAPFDERELFLKARAGSISGLVIAILVIAGCFYGAAAAAFRLWMPRTILEWVYLGLVIQAWMLALPVLVASWLQPAPDRDEEDDSAL